MPLYNTKLLDIQKRTVDETQNLLDKHGKALIIRPTGFGKTYTLVESFAKKYIKEGKQVLYVYPLDIIKTEIMSGKKHIDENGSIHLEESKYTKDGLLNKKTITFVSYQLLTKRFNEDHWYWLNYLNNSKIGLIILDEAHRAGSESFYAIFDTIEELVGPDRIHLLGATATPDRMDDDDSKPAVTDRIFEGNTPFEYELSNAIHDGLIPQLIYSPNEKTLKMMSDSIKKKHKSKFKEDFYEDSYNVELARLRQSTGDEHDVITKATEDAGYDFLRDKYYKFIIFSTDIKKLSEEAEEVENWFNEAFNIDIKQKYGLKKNFEVRSTYLVSSDTEDGSIKQLTSKKSNRKLYHKTQKIEEIIAEDYKVDIIFTVDMINMGYHVEDITGIMMLRGTKSAITYYQQLGRALSVGAEHKPIIFDFVNNISEPFWFKAEASGNKVANQNRGGKEEKVKDTLNLIFEECGYQNLYIQFMKRYNSEENVTEKLLYEDLYMRREMPMYLMALYLNKPVMAIYKKLQQYGFEVRVEKKELDSCKKHLEYLKSKHSRTANTQVTVIRQAARFIYDPRAKEISGEKHRTLYEAINNFV